MSNHHRGLKAPPNPHREPKETAGQPIKTKRQS